MKKTSKHRIQKTFTLDEALGEQLVDEAARLKIPISHLVERALKTYLLVPSDVQDELEEQAARLSLPVNALVQCAISAYLPVLSTVFTLDHRVDDEVKTTGNLANMPTDL